MASTFANSETYGTSGSPTTADAACINLLSTNTASGANVSTNTEAAPIVVVSGGTAYSYERWIRGHWTGTFSSISNVKFYKYSGSPGTGCTLYGGDRTSQTYTTPVNTQSSIATTTGTSWDAENEAFELSYSSNYCDYVVLQLRVADTASPGNGGTMTYRWTWDET